MYSGTRHRNEKPKKGKRIKKEIWVCINPKKIATTGS
jgi:hypothetical protein